MHVKTQLIQLIAQVLPQPDKVEGANDDTRFIEDLGLSSINSIMLISLIESTFQLSGAKLSDKLLTAKTIAEATRTIEAQLKAATE